MHRYFFVFADTILKKARKKKANNGFNFFAIYTCGFFLSFFLYYLPKETKIKEIQTLEFYFIH